MFGVAGDFNLWFLEQSITAGQVRFVGRCNELNASYAADGAARLAGISALATTYGVGELSTLAEVAGAYAEQVSVICITSAPLLDSARVTVKMLERVRSTGLDADKKIRGNASASELT
jgi:indolepyruvate decarboxylase